MNEDYTPVPEDFTFVSSREEELKDSEFSGEKSYLKESYYKFVSKKANVVMFFILIFMVIMAIVGPALSGYKFNRQNLDGYPCLAVLGIGQWGLLRAIPIRRKELRNTTGSGLMPWEEISSAGASGGFGYRCLWQCSQPLLIW